MEKKTIQLDKEVKLKNVESYKTNSDDEVVTVPTANGGMRRKHHRPWTLSEVVKLVEGVAKYGAGRWSEIKRLAFASYSYRTSVDLKVSGRSVEPAKANFIVYTVGLLAFTIRLKSAIIIQDKWRNLLRASVAELPTGNGVS